MKYFIPFLFLTIFTTGCKSQSLTEGKLDVFTISNISYGKIHLRYNEVEEIANIIGADKKFLTLSIYYINGNERVSVPIDDRYFNHEYFHDFDYEDSIIAKLHVKRYFYNNKEYIAEIKIE